MKFRVSVLSLLFAIATGPAQAAEVSGKALFEERCTDCHEASDFSEENPNALAETVGKIVAGHLKHKAKITLSHEEVQAVADYVTKSR